MKALEFDPVFPLANLKPADYNPRFLSEDAFERLKQSLAKHGVVKPVILNANGTLVAGHQRTKALAALGHTTVPAVKLAQQIRLQDEINFNLLHNRVEVEASHVEVRNPPPAGQWTLIPWQDITVHEKKNIAFVSSIATMVGHHGPWGSVVLDDQGRVVLNAEYAVAAVAQRFDVLAWTVPSAQAIELYADLTGEYGVYDWTRIDAPIWNQHLIQPIRLRPHTSLAKKGKLVGASETWERLVLPWLTREHRVVDFGAGHGDYARHLRSKGYHVRDYEPFRTTSGAYAVDIKAIVAMIRNLEADLRQNGLYDVVVLDSVINGTTSIEYQHAVLTVVNALCRADGVVAIGTRNIIAEERMERAKKATVEFSRLTFLDKDNVEFNFHKGKWIMLRFHSPQTLEELLSRYFDDIVISDKTRSTLKAVCRKPKALDPDDITEQIEKEFNMPYPGNYKHGKHLNLAKELNKLVRERNSFAG